MQKNINHYDWNVLIECGRKTGYEYTNYSKPDQNTSYKDKNFFTYLMPNFYISNLFY